MKKDLLGMSVTTGSYRQFVEYIYDLAREGKSSYVCVANVHMLMEANKDADFARIVNNAYIVTPDGMPLVKSLKLLYGIEQSRVAGMDLLPDLLNHALVNNLPVYFYGSTDLVLSRTVDYIDQHYPGLTIAGTCSPPFRMLTEEEEEDVIQNINNSGAKIVFVALGCPKQENWMASMKGHIHACMIGIGGALPVLAGLQKRAPQWMQKTCLEWLFRLKQEPRRLFKRYAITNVVFLYLLMKSWLSIKLNSDTGSVYLGLDPVYDTAFNVSAGNL